jgi:hypothetical protein
VRAKMVPLEEEVRLLKGKVSPLEEEVRQLREDLLVVID